MNHPEKSVEKQTAELQEFLSIISHDLAAPIRHVREFSRLLLSTLETKTSDQQEYSQFVETALNTLEKKLAAITALSNTGCSEESVVVNEPSPLIEQVSAGVYATFKLPVSLRR